MWREQSIGQGEAQGTTGCTITDPMLQQCSFHNMERIESFTVTGSIDSPAAPGAVFVGGPATGIILDDDGKFGCSCSPAAIILAYIDAQLIHKVAANMSCMYYRGPQIVTAELCF